MSVPPIITVIGIALVAGLVIELLSRWHFAYSSKRFAEEVRDRLAYPEKYASENKPRLQPESQYIVRTTDTWVSCTTPDGITEQVEWNDLESVLIATTSMGPFLPDVFWILKGVSDQCMIPLGATGDEELLARLQSLPGFDSMVFAEAMSSTTDKLFVCWRRDVLNGT
jgi:hypothetical protein